MKRITSLMTRRLVVERLGRGLAIALSLFALHATRGAEENVFLAFTNGVRVLVNAPARAERPAGQPVLLVLYALPNGNTIEWTYGKQMAEGDDWHYGIQQIAGQTRFVRQRLSNETVVVAYLENGLKSWPAWRKNHGDASLPEICRAIKERFSPAPVRLVLSGHSGGGSFIFGLINTADSIPNDVVRIAFLDSNYGYDPERGHKDKLARWLSGDSNRHLCVLAYDDASARLDGKPFVSASGGTWGRSHAMLQDLPFSLVARTNNLFEYYRALDGRVQFILRQNPEGKIYHTVQVQKNGFIHSLFSGTPLESKGYEYLGAEAYLELLTKETPARETGTPSPSPGRTAK